MLDGNEFSDPSMSLYAALTLSQFKTNKGRHTSMGPWPRTGLQRDWTLLDQRDNQPGRIFYEVSPWGMCRLAFDTPYPPPSSELFTFPMPQSKSPADSLNWAPDMEEYFYTSATLDGIATVTPSLHQLGGKRGTLVITGLLLHHPDGHTSCVGQVRIDSLGCRFDVDSCLWLGFASGPMGGPCVVTATSCLPSTSDDSLTWLALPCRGLLEWWFSTRQCKLHHEGRESPATCLESHTARFRLFEQQEQEQGIRSE